MMRAAWGRRGTKFCLWASLCAIAGAAAAEGAEFRFAPTFSVTETYSDNVYEEAHDKRSDFITRLQPGAAFRLASPCLNGELSYNFDYHDYARGTRTNEKNHNLSLRGGAELIDSLFFLDFSDKYSRVSLDAARDVTTESLFANQADSNVGSFSPYLYRRFGEKGGLKAGYRFTDTSYFDSPGIDKRENRAFADLAFEPAARLAVACSYSFARVKSDAGDYDENDATASFKYEYAEKSFLYGSIGNIWQDFSYGRKVSNLLWSAGVNRDFGTLLATLEAKVLFTEDPLTLSMKETVYRAALDKTLEHGVLGINTTYTKYADTSGLIPQRRKGAVELLGRYEISPRLTGLLSATADRVSGGSLEGYPYHFNGRLGLSCSFNYDVTATLEYGYVEYRHALDSAADAIRSNRVILTVKKLF